jgi:hypothetical protein
MIKCSYCNTSLFPIESMKKTVEAHYRNCYEFQKAHKDMPKPLPERRMQELCPKCGCHLYTDDDAIWCKNEKCNYEWFP